MCATRHIVRDPCSIRNTLVLQLGNSAVVLVPGKRSRHIRHEMDTQILRSHAVVVEVEHNTVNSQEVHSRRKERLGQKAEITPSVVIGGKVNRKPRHRVGRAIRDCQHRIQRGEVTHGIRRVLADADNQIRIQSGIVTRFARTERHLHVVYRQRCVKRILQHSPRLARTVEVQHTRQVPVVNIV